MVRECGWKWWRLDVLLHLYKPHNRRRCHHHHHHWKWKQTYEMHKSSSQYKIFGIAFRWHFLYFFRSVAAYAFHTVWIVLLWESHAQHTFRFPYAELLPFSCSLSLSLSRASLCSDALQWNVENAKPVC